MWPNLLLPDILLWSHFDSSVRLSGRLFSQKNSKEKTELTRIAKTTFLTFPQCWLIALEMISLDAVGICSTLADDSMNDGSLSMADAKLKEPEQFKLLVNHKKV